MVAGETWARPARSSCVRRSSRIRAVIAPATAAQSSTTSDLSSPVYCPRPESSDIDYLSAYFCYYGAALSPILSPISCHPLIDARPYGTPDTSEIACGHARETDARTRRRLACLALLGVPGAGVG